MDHDVLSTPGHLISLAARGFTRLSEARLKPLGFGVGHLPVLVALQDAKFLVKLPDLFPQRFDLIVSGLYLSGGYARESNDDGESGPSGHTENVHDLLRLIFLRSAPVDWSNPAWDWGYWLEGMQP